MTTTTPQPNTPNTNAPGANSKGAPQKKQGGRRRKVSRYGVQMEEKKNLKVLYGIREEQLKTYYRKALRSKAETGPQLVDMLERRIDNSIFRAGLALTRPQARQMVSHGYFQVNGKKVDIPSYLLKSGDVVSVKESKRTKSYFSNFEKRMQGVRTPSWIEVNASDFGFKFVGAPSVEEANIGIDMRAIVEFFTR